RSRTLIDSTPADSTTSRETLFSFLIARKIFGLIMPQRYIHRMPKHGRGRKIFFRKKRRSRTSTLRLLRHFGRLSDRSNRSDRLFRQGMT
ncbi:MAG: hypothetical protein LBQ43_04420, partial [Holosporales bacterium]|nr:hypothetical protein [Holosporales bacterium]